MMYSATITSGAKSAAGTNLPLIPHGTYNRINSQGLSAVDLGAAGNYVILAKPPSTITLLPHR
jgi:hypothetical protein